MQALQAQLSQHSTGLMADFVMYNHATGRCEPVKGKVRPHLQVPGHPRLPTGRARILVQAPLVTFVSFLRSIVL